MYKLCRIDIGKGERNYKIIWKKLVELSDKLRQIHKIYRIIIFGSYVRNDLNEGSDIDLIIVGEFKERFHKRIAEILDLTDLPIEPMCYTKDEFKKMVVTDNRFVVDALKEGVEI